MNTNTLSLNANGFSRYLAAGIGSADKLPQEALWSELASIYRFYIIEEIQLEFIATR